MSQSAPPLYIMILQELGLKYQTDKATYHLYLDVYEQYLNPIKHKIKRILEIGIKDGNSIKMWRDWFNSEVIVEGWDICDIPKIENTNLKIVDQTKVDQMYENISGLYDFILDDGSHSAKNIETSFATLFPFCKHYIIEDLHAPWCEKIYKNGKFTIDKLENFILNNKWTSKYSTDKQTIYIQQFARVENIFIRGTRENPLSICSIIKNTYYE
jgi:hypothetical protein